MCLTSGSKLPARMTCTVCHVWLLFWTKWSILIKVASSWPNRLSYSHFWFVGTFIAIDISVYMLDATGKTNIEKIVKSIRKQRAFSIQMPDQYLFVHQAVCTYAEKTDKLKINHDLNDILFNEDEWSWLNWNPNYVNNTQYWDKLKCSCLQLNNTVCLWSKTLNILIVYDYKNIFTANATGYHGSLINSEVLCLVVGEIMLAIYKFVLCFDKSFGGLW